MGVDSKEDQIAYYDVSDTPIIGRLDETTLAEMRSDVAIIRNYIRAEKATTTSAPGRTLPPIAREVLTSVWESPRTGFHRDARTCFRRINFRNKLLLIPWSAEAFEHAKSTNSFTGLVLEHVTPIDAMWQKLKELDADSEESDRVLADDMWETSAASYLVNHYMLAVLTKEQATAIDAIPTLRSTGFEPNPFLRYHHAESEMEKNRTRGHSSPDFSVKRFVIPGPPIDTLR